jgi:flavodoxin/Pyruvate/2-oxoacid:ferredoxin oxidoreductase delta subunit
MVYFSQGGTTRKIAEKISDGLNQGQYQTDLHNLVDGPPPDIKDYDMIGIGSPVYIFRPPFNMLDYIKSLPDLNGLPFFVFLLHGTNIGFAGNMLRKTLEGKGGKEIGYTYFKGADYFIGYVQRGVLFSPENPTEEELKSAEQLGRDIASNVSENKYVKPDKDPFPPVVYAIERMITNRFLTKQVYSRFFKVEKEKCTVCNICLELCPMGNIALDATGFPEWDRNCNFCFYCEMKCPEDAISSPVDWLIFAPLINYNISFASKDPTIDQVRVSHTKGKTTLIEG